MTEIVWSYDNEVFDFEDKVEVIDYYWGDDAKPGSTIYYGTKIEVQHEDFLSIDKEFLKELLINEVPDYILDTMYENAYLNIGIPAEDYLNEFNNNEQLNYDFAMLIYSLALDKKRLKKYSNIDEFIVILKETVLPFLDKHCSITFYSVEGIKEYSITQDDLNEIL